MIYPGAGSHSGAFLPGDYVVSVELPALRRVVVWLQHARRRLLPWTAEPGRGAFAIPFVDYARGDGAAIGAGHDLTWRLELIGDDTPWVRDYRGLWGLDTHDPFGGERAPGGAPLRAHGRAAAVVDGPAGLGGARRRAGHGRRGGAAPAVADRRDRRGAGRAGGGGRRASARPSAGWPPRSGRWAPPPTPGPCAGNGSPSGERRERELAALTARCSALAEERAAHEAYLAGPREPARPDAHLRHPHMPYAADTDVRSRFLRVWAAVSTPVLVLGLGGLLVRPTVPVLVGFLTFLMVFGVVEAIGRRRVLAFATVLGALALWIFAVAGLILALLSSWHLVLAGLLAVLALVLLVVNVRELRSG